MGTTLTRGKEATLMSFPPLPRVTDLAHHFERALRESNISEAPYRRWNLTNVFPESMCVGILTLPIAPPLIGDCYGVRDRHNEKRTFFTPELRKDFPTCAVFAEAMQHPRVARAFGEVCNVPVEGSYLRIEYIQDLDGAWLEPHRDIKEKLFSMVVYLCTGPHAKEWGTDIYDEHKKWIGRSSAEFNSAVIFIAGPNTWHGFDKRPIIGVRRLMEINYVHPSWRDREQLSFPERPITVAS